MAEYMAVAVCHIFNCNLREGVFPDAQKVAKIILLIKNMMNACSGTRADLLASFPFYVKY